MTGVVHLHDYNLSNMLYYRLCGRGKKVNIGNKKKRANKQVSVTPVCNKDICGYLRVKTLNKRGQNVENYLNSL